MAELSLRERLQPALLDRLADDERMLTLFELRAAPADLQRLAIEERELTAILAGQGLRPAHEEQPFSSVVDAGVAWVRGRFFAPSARVGLAQLRSLTLKPPGAPQGVTLQSFCQIEARTVLNEEIESAERRFLTARRLREHVCRDLSALLNAVSIDSALDLARYPHVQRSVLNYGMPSLAGVAASGVDAAQTAARIEDAIKRFEPRLQKVRVSPEPQREHADGHQLSFRIEAELWGQPAPLHLVLRTHIDTTSGDVSVTEPAAS
jgi:type VI secretion system protein ImpF